MTVNCRRVALVDDNKRPASALSAGCPHPDHRCRCRRTRGSQHRGLFEGGDAEIDSAGEMRQCKILYLGEEVG
jgi:hypothetical protein